MKIVAVDLGGTKTLLRLCRVDKDDCEVLRQQRYESGIYTSFEAILEHFLDGETDVVNFCVGVAGPVSGEQAGVTNLPWQIHAVTLKQRFGFQQVRLINDFQAIGYGLNTLADSGFQVMQKGQVQPHANQVIIGAGTGLGQAILVWRDGGYEVLASEGGHADFAPTNELQIRLLRFLLKTHDCVSYELLCSGPGLERIYMFLQHERGESDELNAAAITQAVDNQEEVAVQALDLFMSIYGAQAGNLALTGLALGGVYVAGGIAARIADKLMVGPFMESFRHKSKMGALLQQVPVKIVLDPEVGLLGAQEVARRL
ncbi:MAG: glucokinase [Gammaproteobacteria bacterium]|nr:glucokinase [Gammaproteobacteria bacterium]MDH5802293.1 glucokinase [Gammaproteobacteria bacterium]